MKKCPKCQEWTLDFDNYFGRFRCFNGECGWMAPSSAERAIRQLKNWSDANEGEPVAIPELGMCLTPSYDPNTDTFSVDFGLCEPTCDLPDADGRMIWRVTRHTNQVAGFMLAGIRQIGLSGIKLEFIISRKDQIQDRLRRIPGLLSRGRMTKDVLEQVIVTPFYQDISVSSVPNPEVASKWNEIMQWAENQTALSN